MRGITTRRPFPGLRRRRRRRRKKKKMMMMKRTVLQIIPSAVTSALLKMRRFNEVQLMRLSQRTTRITSEPT